MEASEKTTKSKIMGYVAILFGAAVAAYAKINVLVPFLGIVFFEWIANKTVKDDKKPMIPAFAIQAGQWLWITLGTVLVAPTPAAIIIDVILYGLGIFWLIIRPGLVPVIILTIFQVVVLIFNVESYFGPLAIGDEVHRALFVHIILRTGAIIMMTVGIFKMRQKSQAPELV